MKTKLKGLVSLWLALIMVIGMLPLGVMPVAADTPTAECDGYMAWTAKTGELSAGSYYLSASNSTALTGSITIGDGTNPCTVNLCLHGNTLSFNQYNKRIEVKANATLNIYDCSTGETGKITNAGASTDGIYLEGSTSTLNLYSGTVHSETGRGINSYGSVNVYGGSVMSGSHHGIYNDGTLNMTDGTVESQGGDYYYAINNNGTANISGGTITHTKYFPIYIGGAENTLYLSGAPTITCGSSATYDIYRSSGNIYAESADGSEEYSGGELAIYSTQQNVGTVIVNNVTEANKDSFVLAGTYEPSAVLALGTGDNADDLVIFDPNAVVTPGITRVYTAKSLSTADWELDDNRTIPTDNMYCQTIELSATADLTEQITTFTEYISETHLVDGWTVWKCELNASGYSYKKTAALLTKVTALDDDDIADIEATMAEGYYVILEPIYTDDYMEIALVYDWTLDDGGVNTEVLDNAFPKNVFDGCYIRLDTPFDEQDVLMNAAKSLLTENDYEATAFSGWKLWTHAGATGSVEVYDYSVIAAYDKDGSISETEATAATVSGTLNDKNVQYSPFLEVLHGQPVLTTAKVVLYDYFDDDTFMKGLLSLDNRTHIYKDDYPVITLVSGKAIDKDVDITWYAGPISHLIDGYQFRKATSNNAQYTIGEVISLNKTYAPGDILTEEDAQTLAAAGAVIMEPVWTKNAVLTIVVYGLTYYAEEPLDDIPQTDYYITFVRHDMALEDQSGVMENAEIISEYYANDLPEGFKLWGGMLYSGDIYPATETMKWADVYVGEYTLDATIPETELKTAATMIDNEFAMAVLEVMSDGDPHIHNDKIFRSITSLDEITDAGGYCLTGDIEIDEYLELKYKYDGVDLCLNGHSITSSAYAAISLTRTPLNIYDCEGDGEIIADTSAINVGSGSVLNVHGGTLIGGSYAIENGSTANIHAGKLVGDVKPIYNDGTLTFIEAPDGKEWVVWMNAPNASYSTRFSALSLGTHTFAEGEEISVELCALASATLEGKNTAYASNSGSTYFDGQQGSTSGYDSNGVILGYPWSVNLGVEGDGYILPKSITVTVDGKELDSDEYTYNRHEGTLDIPAEYVTGDIVVNYDAVEATGYEVNIGGKWVFSDDLSGDGWEYTPGSAVAGTSAVLTLTDADIHAVTVEDNLIAGIYHVESAELKIVFDGNNSITVREEAMAVVGIYAAGKLSFEPTDTEATLTIDVSESTSTSTYGMVLTVSASNGLDTAGIAVTSPEGDVSAVNGTFAVGDTPAKTVTIKMPHTHCLCGEANCDKTGDGHGVVTLAKEFTFTTGEIPTGTYYLAGDIMSTGGFRPLGDVTICLNGYSITLAHNRQIILNDGDSSLTICDCNGAGSTHHGYWDDHSYIISETTPFVTDYDTLTGGLIYGGYNGSGGAINIVITNTFNLYGGNIAGNRSDDRGGGVYGNGTFNMYGGAVVGNYTGAWGTGCGGGVYISSDSTFNMYDGIISNNKSASSDGSASYGGGVYNYDNGTFKMSGGSIVGNTANNGGGVYNISNVTVSGDAVISGNTANGSASNLTIITDSSLTAGTLTEGANIGISIYDTDSEEFVMDKFTMEYSNTNGTDDPANYFFSDIDEYAVGTDENGEAALVPPHTHVWASTWESNDTHHWHECTADGCYVTANADKDGYGTHTPDADDGNCTTDIYCTECEAVTTKGNSDHSYTYKAEGAVITETCANEGCTAHTATATITKPTGTLTYNGSGFEAIVSYSDKWAGGELAATYGANGNINAGEVTASITKGGATANVSYTIEKATARVINVENITKDYDGTPVGIPDFETNSDNRANAVFTYYDETLEKWLDAAPKNAGSYSVRVTIPESDNYTDAVNAALFMINGKRVELVWEELENDVFDGSHKVPTVKFTAGTLEAGDEHLTLVGSLKAGDNNKNAGEFTWEMSLKDTNAGNYVITNPTRTYTIKPVDLERAFFGVDVSDKVYSGGEIEPDVECISDILTADDYDVEYTSNMNAGTATITITGKRNAANSLVYNFEIKPYTLKKADFKLTESGDIVTDTTYTYDGTEHEPAVTYIGEEAVPVIENTDYTVVFASDLVNANDAVEITITGNNNATGTVTLSYKINKRELADSMITDIEAGLIFDCELQTPDFTVTDKPNGTEIIKASDWTYEYTYNLNATNSTTKGVITVTAAANGNYKGSAAAKFEIAKKSDEPKATEDIELRYDITVNQQIDIAEAFINALKTNDQINYPDAPVYAVASKGNDIAGATVDANGVLTYNLAETDGLRELDNDIIVEVTGLNNYEVITITVNVEIQHASFIDVDTASVKLPGFTKGEDGVWTRIYNGETAVLEGTDGIIGKIREYAADDNDTLDAEYTGDYTGEYVIEWWQVKDAFGKAIVPVLQGSAPKDAGTYEIRTYVDTDPYRNTPTSEFAHNPDVITVVIEQRPVWVKPDDCTIRVREDAPEFKLVWTNVVRGEELIPDAEPEFTIYERNSDSEINIYKAKNHVGRYDIGWSNPGDDTETDYMNIFDVAKNYKIAEIERGVFHVKRSIYVSYPIIEDLIEKEQDKDDKDDKDDKPVVDPQPPVPELVNPFTDVVTTDPNFDSIMYVTENGIMNGTGDGTTFSPNMVITRGMIVTMLYRLEGSPEATPVTVYTDVPDWCADAIAWGTEVGIIKGYGNGLSGAGDSINNEQLAVMLMRYAAFKGINTDIAKDAQLICNDSASISAWALSAVKWAVAYGILEGDGECNVLPLTTPPRGDVAGYFHRFMENVK